MFTGLIQSIGVIKSLARQGAGRRVILEAPSLVPAPSIGASIAVDGVCLTVTAMQGGALCFDAVDETIQRSTLGTRTPGDRVNLEPALRVGDPLDGHIVQGHVDAVGRVLERGAASSGESWRITLPPAIAHLVAEKGSIAVDGLSLTVTGAGDDWFSVSLIPHTLAVTTLGQKAPGESVNLEADVLARYAARAREVQAGRSARGGVTEASLRENGFLR